MGEGECLLSRLQVLILLKMRILLLELLIEQMLLQLQQLLLGQLLLDLLVWLLHARLDLWLQVLLLGQLLLNLLEWRLRDRLGLKMQVLLLAQLLVDSLPKGGRQIGARGGDVGGLTPCDKVCVIGLDIDVHVLGRQEGQLGRPGGSIDNTVAVLDTGGVLVVAELVSGGVAGAHAGGTVLVGGHQLLDSGQLSGLPLLGVE